MSGRPVAGVLPVLVAALLLAGCAASPADARRDSVAALTVAANDRDAEAVRQRADALVVLVRDQLAEQEVPADEAERLVALAESVRAGADAIDPEMIERRRAEQEAEQARQALEQAERELAEQRAAAEQAAREAEQAARDAEQAGGSGGDAGGGADGGGDDKDADKDEDKDEGEDEDEGGGDKGKGEGKGKGKGAEKDG